MASPEVLLTRWFSRRTTLNTHLVRLIIGGLGPLLIFSILMMVLFARQEQGNRRRGLQDTARALALAIDQGIESSVTNLEALATSEPLDFGRVEIFRTVAARFLRAQRDWNSIALFDPKGVRLTSIAKPHYEEGGSLNAQDLDQILRAQRVVVSDFPGPDVEETSISIHVPVVRERTIIYILSAAVDARMFNDILAQQKLPDAWLGTLFNAKRIIIARTRDGEKFIGKPVGSLLGKTNLQAGEQFFSGVTDGSERAHAVISRSWRSGWFVALTIPSREVNAIMYRSLAMLGGGGLFLLLSGLAVALIFARQVSRSLGALETVAHDLGRGRPITLTATSPITELDGLAQEMARAATLLSEREQERDRVEAALRQQEEFLRRQADLLNLANEAIFAREVGGRIIYWNRGAEALYGYSEAEAKGFIGHDLLATEFPGGRSNYEAALLRVGEWSGELQQLTKHGRRIDVESRFKLIDDRVGGRVVLECNRDITERKQTARRLSTEHAVTLALAESETPEAAWSKVLEIMGKGFDWDLGALWMVQKEAQTIECVKIWQRSSKNSADCGARPALAPGMGLPGRVWASEKPVWITGDANETITLKGSLPEATSLCSALAFPIKMRSEILGVAEFYSAAVRDPDDDLLTTMEAIGGEMGQFVERVRAEAALRQSEENLRNQAQELERQLLASGRLVAVGELTASMAHEFNNPLGIILGFAQGLMASLDPADPHYHHVEIIAEEAKRCEKLVQELLEFGRPKNAEFAPTNVEEIVRRTIDLVQPHASKNGVETEAKIAGLLPRICADAQQLQQVLLNLSLNAVDAMPKGGTLTLGATVSDGNEITLTVADSGIGIDADVLPRIFQPFFTSKKRRGLGLGLPICDRIVKAHGGKIEVKSSPGQGTAFEIHLPPNTPAAGEPCQTAA
jgi:PAS domain S-box-containing protein